MKDRQKTEELHSLLTISIGFLSLSLRHWLDEQTEDLSIQTYKIYKYINENITKNAQSYGG